MNVEFMIEEIIIDQVVAALIPVDVSADLATLPQALNEDLVRFLSKCNGGYSKDGYFHFFGSMGDDTHNIEKWNVKDLWKLDYGETVLDYYFFAEDIFGNQFGYDLRDSSSGIFLFWVDDGRLETFAGDFEEFTDYTIFGAEVFKKMRKLKESYVAKAGREIPRYQHLSYQAPLLLGGDAGDINNLEYCEPVSHLKFQGQVVTQCRALPLGTKIKDVLIDKVANTLTLVPE